MLIDTFMFYNELDILELRLEVLDKYVDRFVLVEAEVNHVGGPKKLFFANNRARFTKWLDKIEHVIVRADESPTDPNPWSREKYQRSCIVRGLERACIPNDAHVMVSDVDEIPDMNLITLNTLPLKVYSIHMYPQPGPPRPGGKTPPAGTLPPCYPGAQTHWRPRCPRGRRAATRP